MGDSSNIFKTPAVYYAGLCGKKESIVFYANLCEAFGPCFLNNPPTVLKNIMRDAGETINFRVAAPNWLQSAPGSPKFSYAYLLISFCSLTKREEKERERERGRGRGRGKGRGRGRGRGRGKGKKERRGERGKGKGEWEQEADNQEEEQWARNTNRNKRLNYYADIMRELCGIWTGRFRKGMGQRMEIK